MKPPIVECTLQNALLWFVIFHAFRIRRGYFFLVTVSFSFLHLVEWVEAEVVVGVRRRGEAQKEELQAWQEVEAGRPARFGVAPAAGSRLRNCSLARVSWVSAAHPLRFPPSCSLLQKRDDKVAVSRKSQNLFCMESTGPLLEKHYKCTRGA